jgi:hypothetical protein
MSLGAAVLGSILVLFPFVLWRLLRKEGLLRREAARLTSAGASNPELYDPDPIDAAYLNGGAPQVLRLILYNLWLQKRLAIEGRGPQSANDDDWAWVAPTDLSPGPQDVDPLQRYVFNGIGVGMKSGDVKDHWIRANCGVCLRRPASACARCACCP